MFSKTYESSILSLPKMQVYLILHLDNLICRPISEFLKSEFLQIKFSRHYLLTDSLSPTFQPSRTNPYCISVTCITVLSIIKFICCW